jgi:hypothetical protein
LNKEQSKMQTTQPFHWLRLCCLALVLLSALLLVGPAQSAQAVLVWQVSTVDAGGGFVGSQYSLALDAAGNPVISYSDINDSRLKLAHCNDANCSGNDESIQAVAFVGFFDYGDKPLALDATGFPVISYRGGGGGLMLAHQVEATLSETCFLPLAHR